SKPFRVCCAAHELARAEIAVRFLHALDPSRLRRSAGNDNFGLGRRGSRGRCSRAAAASQVGYIEPMDGAAAFLAVRRFAGLFALRAAGFLVAFLATLRLVFLAVLFSVFLAGFLLSCFRDVARVSARALLFPVS